MDNPDLSKSEVEILHWVKEGKSNNEIGTIIGKSQWTVKYHMSNVMRKLDVSTRTQAVSQAIGLGLLNTSPPDEEESTSTIFVGIIGCGVGGAAVLEVLKDNPAITIVGVAEKSKSAPGLAIANMANIPIFSDYKKLISKKLDVIIDLTKSNKVEADILALKHPKTELMGGLSAMLMWQLTDERRKREREKEKVLREHEALYHLGLIIESIDSMKDAGYAVVDYATKLLNMPAGSMAVFDEKRETMRLIAAKGFSDQFKKVDEWSLRKGGLTSRVFNASGPIFMNDVDRLNNLNPLLVKEGVRSVLAAPLMVEGRIIGILYLNDFRTRQIMEEDISIFSIISVYAGLTIERVKSIEDMRMLTIVDGLTGLYNHRYIMEQFQKEFQRANRHNTNFSVIMLDIDKFKPYNDSFGHLEGNKVLKGVASLFRQNSRVTDVAGRFGGEEFCIIVPELGVEETTNYARKLLAKVAAHSFPNRKITLSAGVATFPIDGNSTMELLEKADKYLYKAKGSGRNCVVSSGTPSK
ncbi:MAG: diguanylate cyclase [Deltaproteobacteria bacterium]|nr:diguanylate cyclase [Deltaproteobacteria bacterium]